MNRKSNEVAVLGAVGGFAFAVGVAWRVFLIVLVINVYPTVVNDLIRIIHAATGR